jgi:hypothetical protein
VVQLENLAAKRNLLTVDNSNLKEGRRTKLELLNGTNQDIAIKENICLLSRK